MVVKKPQAKAPVKANPKKAKKSAPDTKKVQGDLKSMSVD